MIFQILNAIFNKLSDPELLRIRTVCRMFKDVVDEFCEFTVELNDRKPENVERISQLKIKEFKVTKFLEPWVELVPALQENFFLFPNLLQKLKIITKDISPKNFVRLMQEATPFIRELAVVDVPCHIDYNGLTANFVKFEKLEILHIDLNLRTVKGQRQDTLTPHLFRSLISQEEKVLRRLRLYVNCFHSHVSALSSGILSIISEMWETVKELEVIFYTFDRQDGPFLKQLQMSKRVIPHSRGDIRSIDFSKLRRITTLKILKLKNSYPIGTDIWSNILSQQTSLQKLQIDIYPVSIKLVNSVITKNQETLESINLGFCSLVCGSDTNSRNTFFNVAIFKGCKKLKKLSIGTGSFFNKSSTIGFNAQLQNFQEIPDSVIKLHVICCDVLSSELVMRFHPTRVRQLIDLKLIDCGVTNKVGVTGTVLGHIVRNKCIKDVELWPLNYLNSRETRKLNGVLKRYGIPKDFLRFRVFPLPEGFPLEWTFTLWRFGKNCKDYNMIAAD